MFDWLDWVEYDREELYERVWSTPMYKLAKEEGMSDRGLAKVCEKLNIPRPPRGYWQKLRAGRDVEVEPLPEADENTPLTHRRRVIDRRDTTSSDETSKLREAHANASPIIVGAELVDPHPLVAMSLDHLRSGDPPSLREVARVNIDTPTPDARERALRIMDAILKGFEARGIEVEVTRPESNAREAIESKTRALLLGEVVPFSIEEQSKTHTKLVETALSKSSDLFDPKKVYEYEYLGTLELRTHVGSHGFQGLRQLWADGKKQRVEDCLDDFVTGVITLADRLWRREQDRERARHREHAKEREHEQQRLERRHEKRLRDDMNRRLLALSKSREVLELLDLLEERHDGFREQHPEWIQWAESFAAGHRKAALDSDIPEVGLPGEDSNE